MAGTGPGATLAHDSTFADGVTDHWEVAELIARLDPSVAARLLSAHPAAGRCRTCGTVAPCPARTLAEAAEAASEQVRDSPS